MTLQPRILMCPPEFYGIEYEINPWMNTARQADHALASKQWQSLRGLVGDAGAQIDQIEPINGLPDMVFTANAALVFGRRAIVSRFKHAQRQGEVAHFRRWLAEHGWETLERPDGCSFEGAGDALFCGDTLYAGYRQRSDARGHQQIGATLGVRVLPMELFDPYYYHLDTCFCPLAADAAVYYPGAFDAYGRQVLAANILQLLEVEEAEARHFACNAVVIGRMVITNEGCPRLHESLRAAGFTPAATPLGEFVKAGGSAKCLTLRLDGEDAAGWRTGACIGAALAPKGPRIVATVGAAARRKHADAEPVETGLVSCSPQRGEGFSVRILCPSGAESEKHQRFHGLRCAPPAATTRCPSGQNNDTLYSSTGSASARHNRADAKPVGTGFLIFSSLQSGEGVSMPGTYSQLLLHIVFSTKGREPWITGDVAERLYPYIGGIVRAEKGVLYDIGGVEDHVHLYLRWRPDGSVSDLLRTVKARSSKWVHDTYPKLGAFGWQEGYSVFSVSKSQEEAVKKYIAGQAEHHKQEDYNSELLRILRAHGVEFDEKYVFD